MESERIIFGTLTHFFAPSLCNVDYDEKFRIYGCNKQDNQSRLHLGLVVYIPTPHTHIQIRHTNCNFCPIIHFKWCQWQHVIS